VEIHVNTDSNIDGGAGLAAQVEAAVEGALRRFARRVTRVEVHLKDVNSVKGGADDIRCALEARLAGLQPVAVTHNAGTPLEAVSGATDKLTRVLDSTLGRLGQR
jgi:hypothetical protein